MDDALVPVMTPQSPTSSAAAAAAAAAAEASGSELVDAPMAGGGVLGLDELDDFARVLLDMSGAEVRWRSCLPGAHKAESSMTTVVTFATLAAAADAAAAAAAAAAMAASSALVGDRSADFCSTGDSLLPDPEDGVSTKSGSHALLGDCVEERIRRSRSLFVDDGRENSLPENIVDKRCIFTLLCFS